MTVEKSMSDVPTVRDQAIGGLFYAVSSFGIMFANKFVLTTYAFPSFLFLALAQFMATLVLLQGGKMFGVLSYPDFDTYVQSPLACLAGKFRTFSAVCPFPGRECIRPALIEIDY
jgi:hypothetical protein